MIPINNANRKQSIKPVKKLPANHGFGAHRMFAIGSFVLATLLYSQTTFAELTTAEIEQQNDDKVRNYCEQITQAERNTLDLVYEGDCFSAYYRLFYGVDELKLTFDIDIEYDLKPFCRFTEPFKDLRLEGLHSSLPSCFADIESMTVLIVDRSQYFNLSEISGSDSLIILYLSSIEDLNGTLISPSLKSLAIYTSTPSKSIQFENMDTLTDLNINGAHFKTLDAFKGVTKIKNLTLQGNEELIDITAMQYFTELEYLTISGMEGPYVFPVLTNHTKLKDITVWGGYFDAVEQLQYLTGLKKLTLARATPPITDISAWSNLTSLETLDVSYHDIADFTPLAELPKLERVEAFVGNNRATDMTKFYAQTPGDAYVDLFPESLMSCSPLYKEQYIEGKRCNDQQREHCGQKERGLGRWFCTWWYRD